MLRMPSTRSHPRELSPTPFGLKPATPCSGFLCPEPFEEVATYSFSGPGKRAVRSGRSPPAGPQPEADVCVSSAGRDALIKIPIRIGATPLKAIVDSAAEVSLISRDGLFSDFASTRSGTRPDFVTDGERISYQSPISGNHNNKRRRSLVHSSSRSSRRLPSRRTSGTGLHKRCRSPDPRRHR